MADYVLPDLHLPSLFARIGVIVNPNTYSPVFTQIIKRECVKDPNPVNNVAVTNPGILVVEAEIGFVSYEFQSEVFATTTTNANGEYEFMLSSDTYTVCESLPPGWRQTFPALGTEPREARRGQRGSRAPGL
jgi:hypothetical protein